MLGRFEGRSRAHRVAGPLVVHQQLGGEGLELAHALVGADRLANRQDPDGGVTLLDDVPKHVQVRVVGHSRLAYAANGRAHGGLRAGDGLAAPEVELVARAAPGGPSLAAETDPLRVLRALADVDDQANGPAVVRERGVDARVALALAGEALVLAEHQWRQGVQLDAVDGREQRDDRERVRYEVCDDADVRGRARERLL